MQFNDPKPTPGPAIAGLHYSGNVSRANALFGQPSQDFAMAQRIGGRMELQTDRELVSGFAHS